MASRCPPPRLIRSLPAIAAAVLLVGAQPGTGWQAQAQDQPVGAPIKLTPRLPDAAPLEQTPPATIAPVASPAPPATPGIVVEGLADIDGEAVGLLGPSQGGLGATMWAGTQRALVERLLPRLPAFSPFRTAQDLTRRLLLTAATPPAGPARETSLLALRAQQLNAMGNIAAASALVDASPERRSNPDLSRIAFEHRLLAGDGAGACGLAGLVAETSVYWQKAQIFCHAVSGEGDFAALGIELLREQAVDDQPFFTMIAKLSGDDSFALGSGPATPLTFALLLATRTPIPIWFVETAEPSVLAAMAATPAVDLALRLQVGERAEQIGALSTVELTQLYNSVKVTAEHVAAATTTPVVHPAATPRAASYLAAREHTVPAARAEALRSAWDQARAQGGYPAMARMSVDLLAEIAPATSLAWFAADATRALLLTGGHDRALAWYRLAQSEAAFDADAAEAEILAWPLLRLAFGDDQEALLAWDSSRIDAWLAAIGPQDPAAANGRTALLLALLAAQDQPIGTARWGDLVATAESPAATLPETALWFALSDAAAAGRLGETVLLSLIALGGIDAPQGHGLILGLVVASLHRVGLTAEARALAVEAALMAGL